MNPSTWCKASFSARRDRVALAWLVLYQSALRRPHSRQAIHVIDLLRYLVGDITQVHTLGNNLLAPESGRV
jgi:predicted dehydrogenase